MKYDPVDHEARAVAHMAKQILDEEDGRAVEALDKFLTRKGMSRAAFDAIMNAQRAPMDDETYEAILALVSEAEMDKAILAKEIRAAGVSPHSMGAIVPVIPCPDCDPGEHLTDAEREAIFKLGRQSGKTDTVTENMRQHHERISMSTAVAPAPLDLKTLRAAAEALHNATIPITEAKRRMMEAMENLTPAQIPLVQRELRKMLDKHGPVLPPNRAQRRQAAKARRRA